MSALQCDRLLCTTKWSEQHTGSDGAGATSMPDNVQQLRLEEIPQISADVISPTGLDQVACNTDKSARSSVFAGCHAHQRT